MGEFVSQELFQQFQELTRAKLQQFEKHFLTATSTATATATTTAATISREQREQKEQKEPKEQRKAIPNSPSPRASNQPTGPA